jgi:serine protease
MFEKLQSLAKRRKALAAAAVAVTATVMVATHAPADEGLAAEDITPELVAQTASELGIAQSEWTTGKMLLDFVEPDDGEGGSEEEIAALVAQLDAMPGVDVEPAGFYSESEHLYRLSASASTWDRIDDDLLANDLLEVVEPEILYALPKTAAAVADYEPQKGERVQVNDPMFKLQWHMEQIHAPEAWTSQRGDGVVVAVIDTGVAWKDAAGVRQLPDLAGTKFTKGESFINGLPDGLDDHAHTEATSQAPSPRPPTTASGSRASRTSPRSCRSRSSRATGVAASRALATPSATRPTTARRSST